MVAASYATLRSRMRERLDFRRSGTTTQTVHFHAKLTRGGADKSLDWFYAVSPRLTRYSIGLRKPREILIRFSLYQRM
jgi:hypothetical protein